MPWAEILARIGTGSQYEIPRIVYLQAIADTTDPAVKHHLRMMLERRDRVRCDKPTRHPADHWLFGSSSTVGAGQAEDVTPVTAPASKAPAR